MERNIALRLSYDGSAYHGWQVQKTEVTVAETLEQALTKICGHPVKTVGCGRTDAGVHALRYCANFRTDCRIPVDRIPLAVNSRLPGDIAVSDAVQAPEDFNAIGSCIQKEYIYRIWNSPIRDPFLEKRVCFYPQHLDMDLMARAAAVDKIVCAHCEINKFSDKGYIHAGNYARLHGHRGQNPESEIAEIRRDIILAEQTGCRYHVCHVSVAAGLDLVRKGKERGVDVSCETGPHYIVLDDSKLLEEGRFKMNPPLRSSEDRVSIIDAIKDGTIDMIATDHAPHSEDEKDKGLANSAFGIVGIETSFPICYTYLVKPGHITLDRLIELMAINPRVRFGVPFKKGDFTVWDLNDKYAVNPDEFLSKGRATPFTGMEVYGRCLLTVHEGKVVYQADDVEVTE